MQLKTNLYYDENGELASKGLISNFFINLFNPPTIVLRIKSQRKKNNIYRIKLRFFGASKIKEIDSLIYKYYG